MTAPAALDRTGLLVLYRRDCAVPDVLAIAIIRGVVRTVAGTYSMMVIGKIIIGIGFLAIAYAVAALIPGLFIRERMFDPRSTERLVASYSTAST